MQDSGQQNPHPYFWARLLLASNFSGFRQTYLILQTLNISGLPAFPVYTMKVMDRPSTGERSGRRKELVGRDGTLYDREVDRVREPRP